MSAMTAPERHIPSDEELACPECGAIGTLDSSATLIGCRLCRALWGRVNEVWIAAEPPRPGIVAAMKRPVPSDAHLCERCKLKPRADCCSLCSRCHVAVFRWECNLCEDVLREFRDAGKGG